MIRRSRRSVPATLVALVLLALSGLVTIAATQLLLGQPPIISVRNLTAPVIGRAWNDPITITIGAVAAVLGLVLLLTALLPGRPTVLPLADEPDGTASRLCEAGVSRPSLRKDLTSTVATADGVSSSRVTVRRRLVTAAVRTPATATAASPNRSAACWTAGSTRSVPPADPRYESKPPPRKTLMTNPNRPARLNRFLLLLAGVVLLTVGAFVLLTAFGIPALPASDTPITSRAPTLAGWAPWATAVLAVIVGLLCLRWLLAQTLRRAKTGAWQYSNDPRHGGTHLDADTATVPLTEEIQNYPGLHRARARLAGNRTHPVLHLLVATEDHADIGELRQRINTEALPRMRQALELDHLDTDLLMRLDDATRTRTH